MLKSCWFSVGKYQTPNPFEAGCVCTELVFNVSDTSVCELYFGCHSQVEKLFLFVILSELGREQQLQKEDAIRESINRQRHAHPAARNSWCARF